MSIGMFGDPCQHFSDNLRRKRGPVGFACLVAEKPIQALLATAVLPTPNSRAADASAPRDFQHRQSLGGKQDNLCPLTVFQGAIAITDDGKQSFAIFGADDDIDGVSHAAMFGGKAAIGL